MPSYTVPKSFDAHYTVALSAVDYYKDELAGRPLPSGGEDIPYPPANLTEIMQAFPGVKFLGQFANGNYSGLRWAFLFPADHDHPDVVINVSPKETAEEMITAFWTGLDAIRCYQQVGEVPPQNSDKTTFQNLNPDGTVPNPANI